MRCLDPFFASPYVRQIVETCRGSLAVQGILVDIHLQWLSAWRIGEHYDPNNPDKGLIEALAEGPVGLPSRRDEPSNKRYRADRKDRRGRTPC